jgi:hypothetical protein
MCPECDGLGQKFTFDPDLLVPDRPSVFDGAIPSSATARHGPLAPPHLRGVAKTLGIDLKQPWKDLPKQHRDWLLYGSGEQHITYEWKQRGGKVWKHGGTWEGVVPQLLTSFKKTAAGPWRMALEKYMRVVRCPACQGQRLNPQARAVRVGGKTLVEMCALPIGGWRTWMESAPLEKSLAPCRWPSLAEVLKEIRGRVGFLLNVVGCTISLRSLGAHAVAASAASGWPDRSAAAWSACSTSSTSRPSACTRATTTGCCAPWRTSATWATPSSSSSTTRTPCAPPTGSSISAPARACAAGRSSPPGATTTSSPARRA